MKSRIDQRDLEHLEAFPGDQKEKVMRKIMSLQPTEHSRSYDGEWPLPYRSLIARSRARLIGLAR